MTTLLASPFHFRPAREEDVERCLDIHTNAYPDARGHAERRKNFVQNDLGTLEDLRVAERGGTVVGHAFLFPMQMGFGGARVAVGGVASVAVAPEARGMGVAAALLDHLHAEANARGDAVCVLHAFRQGFYARRGYAPVTPSRLLRFHPRAVPRAWRADGVRAVGLPGDLDGIIACYDRALHRGTGMIVRTRKVWESRIADERRVWLVVARGDAIVGYVAWTLSQAVEHGPAKMWVKDLVADDDDARRALFAVLGAQRDQVTEVALAVPEGDPVDRALTDIDQARFGNEEVEHSLGELVAGPMVYLVDPARALGARGYREGGELTVAAGAGGATLRLATRKGRSKVGPAPEEPAVRFHDEAALAAVLYGALPVSAAARLGWAFGEPSAIAKADALLALPPYFALDAF